MMDAARLMWCLRSSETTSAGNFGENRIGYTVLSLQQLSLHGRYFLVLF
jgi:hypothetical protein